MIKVKVVQENDGPCEDPYHFHEPNEKEKNCTDKGDYGGFFVFEDGEENADHEKKCNCNGKSKVDPEPGSEGEVKALIFLIETNRLVFFSESKANDPSSNKQNDNLLIVSKLVLILCEGLISLADGGVCTLEQGYVGGVHSSP